MAKDPFVWETQLLACRYYAEEKLKQVKDRSSRFPSLSTPWTGVRRSIFMHGSFFSFWHPLYSLCGYITFKNTGAFFLSFFPSRKGDKTNKESGRNYFGHWCKWTRGKHPGTRLNILQFWSLKIRRLVNFMKFKSVVRRILRLQNCEMFGRARNDRYPRRPCHEYYEGMSVCLFVR